MDLTSLLLVWAVFRVQWPCHILCRKIIHLVWVFLWLTQIIPHCYYVFSWVLVPLKIWIFIWDVLSISVCLYFCLFIKHWVSKLMGHNICTVISYSSLLLGGEFWNRHFKTQISLFQPFVLWFRVEVDLGKILLVPVNRNLSDFNNVIFCVHCWKI